NTIHNNLFLLVGGRCAKIRRPPKTTIRAQLQGIYEAVVNFSKFSQRIQKPGHRGSLTPRPYLEVRLDEHKAAVSAQRGRASCRFWLSTSRLRSNFVTRDPPGTEDHV